VEFKAQETGRETSAVWKARADFFRGVQGGQEGSLPWRALAEGEGGWWQEGQAQRCLHEKATNISWAQRGHPPSLFELRRDKAQAGETFAQVLPGGGEDG